jgi:DUF4097 and DUF4098 domain-containing protein YvlB
MGCSASGVLPQMSGNTKPTLYQVFRVQDGGMLNVHIQIGDIQIDRGGSGQAEVSVFMQARDVVKAQTFLEQLRFYIAQEGGGKVEVQTNAFNTNWRAEDTGSAQILVKIRVPETFNLVAQTENGHVTSDCFRGNIALATLTGNIRAGCFIGEEADVQTANGVIDIGQMQIRRSALVRSDGGKISIGEFAGANLNVETKRGNVDLNRLNGSATLRSDQGKLDVRGVEGILTTNTLTGQQKVSLRTASQLNLQSNSGDLYIDNTARQGLNLELSGKSIEMGCLKGFRGNIQDNSVLGTLNGGGGRISARTNGKVTVDE